MKIFYNPNDMQVMAIYSGDTTSTVWDDLGYIGIETNLKCDRDCKVVVTEGKVTNVTEGISSIQPQLNDQEKLELLKTEADEEIAEKLRMSGVGPKAKAYQRAKQ